MNSPQFKGQVETMLPSKIDDEIYYLDNKFLVIGDVWFMKLSSILSLLKK